MMFLRRAAIILTLILPVTLLHARAGAEILIPVIDALFIAAMVRQRATAWATRPWFLLSGAWWLWEVLCTLPGIGQTGTYNLVEALALIRLILFAAALESWILTGPLARRLAWLGVALSCLWIGIEVWQQFLTGRNIFGDHRWPDGALTGPFWEPRAGAPFAHLLCAALLPVVLPLLNRVAAPTRAGAVALAVLGIATTILIGQRMPTMLALLALLTSCLFIRRLRPAAAIAVGLGAVLLAATPVISPPTYAKLVLHFFHQMQSFALSPYGQLYTRAATMGLASPWHGYGFDGFKLLCPQPAFAGGFPAFGIAPTQLGLGACNIHPHNFYLQAFTDAGWPGLALFAAMNLSWLATLAHGLWRNPDPLRVGLFAGVLTYAWPLASTDSFAVLPHAGWLYLLLGLGLAAAHNSGQFNKG